MTAYQHRALPLPPPARPSALLCYWGKDRRLIAHDHEAVEVVGEDDTLAAIRLSDGTFASVPVDALIRPAPSLVLGDRP